MDTVLAIPSAMPGGLDAGMGMHFGHCEVFTIVKIENDAVTDVTTMTNPPHTEGGCLTPVQLLADRGVKVMLAGGMGFRPLAAFNQVGIRVYYTGNVTRVQDSVDAFIQGKLPEFSQDQTCKHHHG